MTSTMAEVYIYNERRYGSPWVAKVVDGKMNWLKNVYEYDVAEGDGGIITIEDPEISQIYAVGQKDYRGGNTATIYMVWDGSKWNLVNRKGNPVEDGAYDDMIRSGNIKPVLEVQTEETNDGSTTEADTPVPGNDADAAGDSSTDNGDDDLKTGKRAEAGTEADNAGGCTLSESTGIDDGGIAEMKMIYVDGLEDAYDVGDFWAQVDEDPERYLAQSDEMDYEELGHILLGLAEPLVYRVINSDGQETGFAFSDEHCTDLEKERLCNLAQKTNSKRIGLMPLQERTNEAVQNAYGGCVSYDLAVMDMDDDVREAVHSELAPCSAQEFFDAYSEAHYDRFGEEFAWAAVKG